ncbi:MAG: hypothetical protein ACXAB4_05915 [Candidatus Hodarchaeales archaeon]|jgi:hypothetical protein
MVFDNRQLRRIISFAVIILVLCLATTAITQGSGNITQATSWQVWFNPGDRTVYEILGCDLDEASEQSMISFAGLPNVNLQKGVQFTVEVTRYLESWHPDVQVDGVFIFNEGTSHTWSLNLNAFLGPSHGIQAVRAFVPATKPNGEIFYENRTYDGHTTREGYYWATGWLAYYFDNSSEWLWEVIAIEAILARSNAELNRSELGFHGLEWIFLLLAFPIIYRIKRGNSGKLAKNARN